MPDFMAQTRAWEESKRVAPILLKVVMTNKSQDKDLKVRFRLATQNENQDGLNITLKESSKKAYLARKNQRIIETITKIDPSKPYFFKDVKDIKVELEVIVRNAEAP